MAAKKDMTLIIDRIQRSLKDAGRKRVLRPIAREAIKLIVDRVRRRGSVKKDGAIVSRFLKLEDSTIRARRRFAFLSQYTTPETSNLHMTGEMIESIAIKSSKPGTIVIGPIGKRNRFLASLHDKGTKHMPDRPFMNISKGEKTKLTKFYRRTFLRLLKKEKLT